MTKFDHLSIRNDRAVGRSRHSVVRCTVRLRNRRTHCPTDWQQISHVAKAVSGPLNAMDYAFSNGG